MLKIIKKANILVWILIIIGLSGCNEMSPCVEADDFGLPKFYVDSNVAVGDLISPNVNNKQVSKWYFSGYQSDGTPLIISVRDDSTRSDNKSYMYSVLNPDNGISRWSPWGSTYADGNIFNMTAECVFKDNNMCYANLFEAPISNPPCYFRNGIGLYMLITAPGAADPNANALSAMNPESYFGKSSALVAHLGQQSSNSQGFNYEQTPPGNLTSGNIYFKILDNVYTDNLGGYQVVIKSGVESNQNGFLIKCINYVQENLAAAQKKIFTNVVQNSVFISVVYLFLILHISYLGIKIALGLAEFSQREFAGRVFKIGLVFVLLSDISWNFFYNYFFTIFIEGVSDIEGYIFQPGQQQVIFAALDKFLMGLVSSETSIKLRAAINGTSSSGFLGVIFVGLTFALAIFFSVIIIFKMVIIYCISLVSMAILVSLAPIFLSFMLFDFFKHLYTNWLKRFISSAVEIVLITVFVALFCTTINTYFHKALGFKACFVTKTYSSFLKFSSSYPLPIVDLTPGLTDVLVPDAFIDPDTGEACAAYQCTRSRYADLPYLDPQNSQDATKIEQIKANQYLTIGDGFKMILMMYFMSLFFNSVSSLAGLISGSSGILRGGIAQKLAEGIDQAPAIIGGQVATLGKAGVDMAGSKILGRERYQMVTQTIDKVLGQPRKLIRQISDLPGAAGRSVVNKYEKATGVRDIKDWGNYKRDRIGIKLDAAKGLSKMAKDQVVNSLTFGLAGKDTSKDFVKRDGKKISARDIEIETYGKELGWSREKIDSVKGKAEKIVGYMKKGKYATGGMLVGAVVGGVPGAVVAGAASLGYIGRKIYREYKSAREDVE